MKQIAIFDLDGTLLDTIADLAQSTNFALSQLGYPENPEQAYHMFVGNGINKLIERALPKNERSSETILKARKLFIPFYNEHNRDFTKPYPGITQLLSDLQDKGIKIAVASNKYQEATELLVHHYFPNINFEIILGQRENIPTKPDPTIVQQILEYSNCSKEEAIYIGDSGIDMQTANNAQVDAIGVSWGFRPIEDLLQYNPKYTVGNAIDIKNIILS